jgi:hypothetical protein
MKEVKSSTAKLNYLEDLKQQLADLKSKLNDVAVSVTKDITSNGSHNSTRYSQLPYLKAHLLKAHLKQLDPEFFNKYGENIAELLLFAKYITEGYSNYNSYFDELYDESFLQNIEAISKEDKFQFFSLITDLLTTREIEKEINSIDEERLKHRNFFASFETGRVSAYNDYTDKQSVIITNPETQHKEQYVVTNITAKKNDDTQELSLLGHIYTPATRSKHPIVYISWRGSINKESWYSDTQLAAGVESYLTHEFEILEQISRAIKATHENHGEKVNLFVTGHSLGGGLAQTCYNSIQRALLRENPDIHQSFKKEVLDDFSSHIDKKHLATLLSESIKSKLNPNLISRMDIGVWNSPGVLNSVARSSNICSEALVDLNIEQHGHFALVSGDLVQTCGDATILTGPNNKANVDVLYLDNGQASCNTKIAAVGAGALAGGVAGSIIPVPGVGTASGGTVGGVGMASLMFYAQKLSHSNRFYNEEGGLTENKQVLKSHALKDSATDQSFVDGHLNNKSKIIKLFANNFSPFDLSGKREEINTIAENIASVRIQSLLPRARSRNAKNKAAVSVQSLFRGYSHRARNAHDNSLEDQSLEANNSNTSKTKAMQARK